MTDFAKLAMLKGLVTSEVGKALYRMAREVPGGQAIVELGSYHGKSTCYLASGARDGGGSMVYAVDAWSPRVKAWSKHHAPPTAKQFRRALRVMNLADQVVPMRGLTTQVAKRYQGPRIGLLYVDADHEMQTVLDDVHAWMPHLHPDALIVFDDYEGTWNPGVKLAVHHLCAFDVVGQVDDFIGPLEWDRLEADRLAVCGLR